MAENPTHPVDPETEALVRRAVDALKRGDLAGAHAAAEQGLSAGSEHPMLLKTEALWLQSRGQLQEALRMFHHARTVSPQDPSILDGIAGCLAQMGAYDEALQMIDLSLGATGAAPSHYMRAWILELAGRYDEARLWYEQTLVMMPDHIQAHAGLATVSAHLKDFAAARKAAERVLARMPGHPGAISVMARVETAEGQADKAEARLRALLNAPGLPPHLRLPVINGLAAALDAQNKTAEAAEWRQRYAQEAAALTPPATN